MSATGRIPVFLVDPKIEERLRRKREKQRIYDRRRREAGSVAPNGSTQGGIEDGRTKCETVDESAVLFPAKAPLKTHAPPGLRRGSSSSLSSRSRSRRSTSSEHGRPEFWLHEDPAPAAQIAANASPTSESVSPLPSDVHTPPDVTLTEVAAAAVAGNPPATMQRKWSVSASPQQQLTGRSALLSGGFMQSPAAPPPSELQQSLRAASLLRSSGEADDSAVAAAAAAANAAANAAATAAAVGDGGTDGGASNLSAKSGLSGRPLSSRTSSSGMLSGGFLSTDSPLSSSDPSKALSTSSYSTCSLTGLPFLDEDVSVSGSLVQDPLTGGGVLHHTGAGSFTSRQLLKPSTSPKSLPVGSLPAGLPVGSLPVGSLPVGSLPGRFSHVNYHHHQQQQQLHHPHPNQYQHAQRHALAGSLAPGPFGPAGASTDASPVFSASYGGSSTGHPRRSASYSSFGNVRSFSFPAVSTMANLQSKPRRMCLNGRDQRRSQPNTLRRDDLNTHLNLLAADWGINTIDVSDATNLSDHGGADFVDRSAYPAFWDSRRSSGATTFSSAVQDSRAACDLANQPFELFDTAPQPIVDPLLPEPVPIEFYGNESAHESVYESLCESAFEDSPPPDPQYGEGTLLREAPTLWDRRTSHESNAAQLPTLFP